MSLAGPAFQSRPSSPPSAEAETKPPVDHPPTEPFGQTGVRQYIGRLLTWVCITASLCAGAMWYRSLSYADRLEWRANDRSFAIRSFYGRLQISAAAFANGGAGNSGWVYRGSYFRRAQDRWAPSIWKVIGIQYGFDSIEQGATGGAWLRVKWYFVAGVFALLPVVRWVLGLRRLRDEAE